MIFGKVPKGGMGGIFIFQLKNLYCRFWTFIQGLFRTFSEKIAIYEEGGRGGQRFGIFSENSSNLVAWPVSKLCPSQNPPSKYWQLLWKTTKRCKMLLPIMSAVGAFEPAGLPVTASSASTGTSVASPRPTKQHMGATSGGGLWFQLISVAYLRPPKQYPGAV